MNVLQLGAFALTTLGSPDAVPAEGQWLGLDQEIENLASSLSVDEGLDIGGYVRAALVNTSDFKMMPTDPDISGFSVENARINVSGMVGDYGFLIESELTGETDPSASPSERLLRDVKAWWNCGENFTVTLGNFKVPFAQAYLTDRNQMMFLSRAESAEGNFGFIGPYATRDEGLMLSGNMDMFGWRVAVQDGEDGDADEYRITGRVEFDVMGNGVSDHEGGYGIGDEDALSIGAAWTDDGFYNSGTAITVDATLNMNPFTASAAFYDNDTDIGDNSPFHVAASYMFQPNEWEGAVRYEDLDDPMNTSMITLGVNWYLYGPDSKWQLNFVQSDSDDTTLDGNYVAAGLTLSF